MNILTGLNNKLMKLTDWINIFLMAVLVTLVSFQVLNRFIFHMIAPWTEEISRYVFVWLSLFGAAKAIRVRSHLAIDTVIESVSSKTKMYMLIFVDIFVILFSVIFFTTGIKHAINNLGLISTTTKVPMVFVHLGIPFSALLIFMFSLELLVIGLRSTKDDVSVGSKLEEEVLK